MRRMATLPGPGNTQSSSSYTQQKWPADIFSGTSPLQGRKMALNWLHKQSNCRTTSEHPQPRALPGIVASSISRAVPLSEAVLRQLCKQLWYRAAPALLAARFIYVGSQTPQP